MSKVKYAGPHSNYIQLGLEHDDAFSTLTTPLWAWLSDLSRGISNRPPVERDWVPITGMQIKEW